MRTFFAIDGGSRMKPGYLQDLLRLSVMPGFFEVLPLEPSRFSCERNDIDGMCALAVFEGEKVLKHYPDAAACVVVIGVELPSIAQLDALEPAEYIVIVPRDGKTTKRLLNPVDDDNVTEPTSPALVPALGDTILELAPLQRKL